MWSILISLLKSYTVNSFKKKPNHTMVADGCRVKMLKCCWETKSMAIMIETHAQVSETFQFYIG